MEPKFKVGDILYLDSSYHDDKVNGQVQGFNYDRNYKNELCYVVKREDNGTIDYWWFGFCKKLSKLEKALK